MKFSDILHITIGSKKRGSIITHHDPYKDWLNLLLLSFILSLIIIAIDGYLFYKISRGELFVPTKDTFTKVETLDRTSLKKSNEFYDAKQAHYFELKASRAQSIDPSL